MKIRAFTLVVCCLLSGYAFAAEPFDSLSSYADFVDGLIDQEVLRGASWSILIHALDGDSAVYERDADRRLIPASVAKVVTSAAALDALGPNFRFETVVSTNATLDNEGRLRGDLIVQAGGDPTIGPMYLDSLHSPILSTWADTLRARGVRRVEGNLILRTWPYRLQVFSPDWEVGDVNDRFGPTVDGFGFNSNVCQLAIFPGAFVGARALLTMDPSYAPVEIRSSVTTGTADTQPAVSFRLVPEDTIVYVTGETPLGDDGEYLWISLQNPTLFFGRALLAALLAQGIEIAGDVIVQRGPFLDYGTPLFIHRSPPLSEVIKLMNKESDNYTSEYVLRAIGAKMNKSGDLRSGLRAAERFLQELGIDERGIYLRDGCGLSRQDLCSARGLVEVLKAMYVHPASEAYIASMSISGTDGTIGFRMASPEMTGRVRAKTGTINHVSNLAGYLFGENGQMFFFAILCNNFPSGYRQHVRYTQDTILERLYFITANLFPASDH